MFCKKSLRLLVQAELRPRVGNAGKTLDSDFLARQGVDPAVLAERPEDVVRQRAATPFALGGDVGLDLDDVRIHDRPFLS